MKNIYKLPLYTILTVTLGTTFVSANTPMYVASVTGSSPTTTSVEMGTRASIYRYNQDNDIKEKKVDEKDYEKVVDVNNQKDKASFNIYTYGEDGDAINITNVTTTDDRVSMTRTIPVKLFWFFPSTMSETATVISYGNNQNQVAVTRPWWSIFSKGSFSEEEITGDIELRIKNIPNSEFTTLPSTSTKEILLAKMYESFLLTSSSSLILK